MFDDCVDLPEGSRIRQICEGRSELSLKKVNVYRKNYGLPEIAAEDAPKSKDKLTPVVRFREKQQQEKKPCCGGSAQPRNPATIRKPMSTRPAAKESTVRKLLTFADAVAAHVADGNAQTSASDSEFRHSCCKKCPYNVDDKCSICKCPLVPNSINTGKIAWRSESCPLGQWFRQTDKSQPLVDPIRNLVFHIYPRIGCEWNWHSNVQHIRDNDHIWNGKRIISIMTGDGLVSPETVQRQFEGIRVDRWIIMPNQKTIGETAPFILGLKQVESVNPNEITMLAHCKGITHARDGKEQIWREIMWQVCLDLPSVQDALASHACAGPFKRHMRLLKSSWHYSGHFCWIRHKDVFSRPWQVIVQQRAGMEAWEGSIIDNKNAACLFHDNPPVNFLDQSYWDEEILPEFARWKESRGIA